jgi:hypothetical protein
LEEKERKKENNFVNIRLYMCPDFFTAVKNVCVGLVCDSLKREPVLSSETLAPTCKYKTNTDMY